MFARLPWRTLLAFGLPFTLYVLTAAPTIYGLDSAELTTAAATLGITRATGYPLYIMLGHVWSWLPVGDVGYRLNLFSAFWGAVTVALAERWLARQRVGAVATLGALGLLTTAYYFWALSLIAEVYTLHTALLMGLLLALEHWRAAPTPGRLALVALCLGLGFAHHAATVLLVPGVLWWLFTLAPRQVLQPKALGLAVLAGVLGLSCYLYLPWRYSAQPAFNYAGGYSSAGEFVPFDLHTWAGFWRLVSARDFTGSMLPQSPWVLWQQAQLFGGELWRAFMGVGLGPGLLGLGLLVRRQWQVGGACLLMFVGHVLFYINYQVIDKETMFLPAYVLWALWIGVGYQALWDWLKPPTPTTRSLERWVFSMACVAAVVVALGWNWPLVDLSQDWRARQQAEAVLAVAEPHAVLLGWWGFAPTLQYLQLVEGQRPDVYIINRFMIDPTLARTFILTELQRQRPVYADLPSGDWQGFIITERVGEFYRLRLAETAPNSR